ncbi:hypothetical protein, partial [Klebsiella pneumoniae]|uniref:hypothetical protein n=1 Tax=Klebsiella pneumoniae TaxID=573 RepID=UPI0019537543
MTIGERFRGLMAATTDQGHHRLEHLALPRYERCSWNWSNSDVNVVQVIFEQRSKISSTGRPRGGEGLG